jgi:hypothetical protein
MSTADPRDIAESVSSRERARVMPQREPSRVATATERRALDPRGAFAYPALVAASGLLVTSIGLALARSDPGSGGAEFLFWLGLLMILVPFAFALVTHAPTRTERLASIVFLGLVLYLVKIVHDPYGFVYADEWVHTYNAQEIVRTGALFHPNPIIPVTARYPGLETVTAALASVAGIGVYAAGVILLGAVRLVLVLALFLLFERLTGSPRVASIAALVYLTNPNFLFWTAQFSYESLALPLVLLATFATVRTAFDPRTGNIRERRGWWAVALLASLGVIATHHLSAYALCIFLVAVTVTAACRPATRRQAPYLLTALVVIATLLWEHLVAPATYSYLVPVLGRAFHETIDTITGHTSGRGLFQAAAGTHQQVASTWQRAIAILAVALVVLALPIGLREILRRHRDKPVMLVLGAAAVVYVAVLPMRLVPAAWETSNRSSEFLYVGVALAIGLAVALWRFADIRFAGIAAACAAILAVGGVVAGWPPRVLLSLPYRVQTGGAVIPPQPRAAADWAAEVLGRRHRFVAPAASGRELLVHGGEWTWVSDAPFKAETILYGDTVTAGIVDTLGQRRITYVELARRASADDSMAGYFFMRPGTDVFVDPSSWKKYDVFPGVSRLLDTGDLFVYDVRSLWSAG